MLVEVARTDEIARGGMKAFTVGSTEVVVCNSEGTFYAIERRCGHMNAPLDRGTLTGYILTCPMHCAQFDVTTGEALSGPVPMELPEKPPPALLPFFGRIKRLMGEIKTRDIKTYRVVVEDGVIKVDL